MLDCMRQAVTNTLERKRRLGQYAVLWSGGASLLGCPPMLFIGSLNITLSQPPGFYS